MAGAPIDSQAEAAETFLASREKPNNGYGQNGFQGPSSDLPGKSTRMDRDYGLDADPSAAPGDWQTRPVSAEQKVPTAYGMKSPDSKIDFPTNNVRRATKQAAPGSFQR